MYVFQGGLPPKKCARAGVTLGGVIFLKLHFPRGELVHPTKWRCQEVKSCGAARVACGVTELQTPLNGGIDILKLHFPRCVTSHPN
mgnify:CR=1 FL=1